MLAMWWCNRSLVDIQVPQIENNVLSNREVQNILEQLDDRTKIEIRNQNGISLGQHSLENIQVFWIENLIMQVSSDLNIMNGHIAWGNITLFIQKEISVCEKKQIIQKWLDLSQHLNTLVEVGSIQLKVHQIIDMPDLQFTLNTEWILEVQHICMKKINTLINNN